MIKKQYRLKDKKDFSRVYSKGRFLSNHYFVIYYYRQPRPSFRVGFSVSRKIGKAVVRNAIKRRLREICRQHEELFPAGYDYIFIARPAFDQLDYWQTDSLVQKQLHRLTGILLAKKSKGGETGK